MITEEITTQDIVVEMERSGGSFVKQLAKAYMVADPANKARLEKAFPDYFEAYRINAAYREMKRKENA